MDKPKLIETADGSHSLYLRDMNETYHSTHGALTESRYVFLKQGVEFFLDQKEVKSLKILEIGFGTGLNALMMLDFAKQRPGLNILFDTVEPFPLSEEIYKQLNFAKLFDHVEHEDLIQLHHTQEESVLAMENFKFLKRLTRVQGIDLASDYDIIFFDAFAPSKQSEMWEFEVIDKMHSALSSGGVLATYCAQGQFKRNMRDAGFEIETLDGPPGKKEMVRGKKH